MPKAKHPEGVEAPRITEAQRDAEQDALTIPWNDNVPMRRPAGVPERMDIRVETIIAGRFQPRSAFVDAEINELAESIREHGILTALKVFVNEAGLFELIAGERRLRAAKLASLETVPCEVCEYTLRQIHEISIIDNLQRADLTPLEEGRAYERMIAELRLSEVALAKRVGKSRGYIQQRRALARACPEVQQALTSGAISFTQARLIAQSTPDPKAQRRAVKEIAQQEQGGQRVSEAQAQEITAKASLEAAKKPLQRLGWSFDTQYLGSKPIIWAPGERPWVATGAEIAEIVQAGREASQVHPGTGETLTAEDRRLLCGVGELEISDRMFAPWLCIHRHREPPAWYTVAEAQRMTAPFAQERDAVYERYAVAGWSIAEDGGFYAWWNAVSPQGRREGFVNWAMVLERIAQIEAGTAKVQPEPKQAGETCPGCGQVAPLRYTPGDHRAYLCTTCRADVLARREAEQEQRRVALRAAWGDWLATAPRDALEIIAFRLARGNLHLIGEERGWIDDAELQQRIAALDDAALAEIVIGYGALADARG